eukprot:TRINITY_DN61189_c0_g1_i2.p2 TRINITY_DN61189_c0_g1~~TRINITY_DN61189_c0_g1_i2.p2  ORF type:complete len:164 (-),score=40.84 TRINITY_DN61189_c0_g1_i2:83-574(-)
MIRRPPRSTQGVSSAASDVYKRQDNQNPLISIPNGAHGAVALSIMDGTWDYRDTGLLDTTHLKFYDRNHLLQLLDEKGYLVSRLDRVIVHPRDTEFKTEWEKYPREVTAYIEKVNPEFQTYQFIVQAYPASEIGWKVGLGSACLLYTSPSPRDLSTSRMPSSA